MLYILAAVVAIVALNSCSKDDSNGRLDANAMISLRPAAGVKSADVNANPDHLTASEIVEQAATMWWYNKIASPNPIGRSFADHQRDFINNRLLMYGTDIIAQDGSYENGFIKGEDMVLIRGVGNPIRVDTIAYIPNAVLRTADAAIRSAYDKQDYTTCYQLFDKAFTFIPITGAEWRELKARNAN